MTPKAHHALHAARHRRIWGTYATRQYALKHTTLALYRLALQLQAMEK